MSGLPAIRRLEKEEPMIIRQGETKLVEAGLFRVIGRDDWSVTIETHGLAPNGDQVCYQVALSNNELAVLMRAAAGVPQS